ncbi:unnamed protein product [Rotaria sordida]|uniref:Uncharacterized protein n=1 Tax=Rotaria sordida TaxID=392033 RepID=A0A815DJ56_9BILA|nr:unnamed protein product [Rotaria sordida]
MNIFHLYLSIICIILTITVSKTIGFQETDDDDDDNFQNDEDLSIEIPRARSNTFLRAFTLNDNDDSQDDNLIDQERIFIRRHNSNSTYYKDRYGRICVLCKWNILPCCEPHICKKHHIRFNECVEIKGR